MVTEISFSVDYNFATKSGTFIVIPRAQLLSNNSNLPREEAQRVDGINGTPLSAAVLNQFAIAVALDETDTFAAALRTAQDCLDPVWFKFKELNKNPRVVGGEFGCTVIVEERVLPEFGDLEMMLISGAAAGTTSGSTFEEAASGS